MIFKYYIGLKCIFHHWNFHAPTLHTFKFFFSIRIQNVQNLIGQVHDCSSRIATIFFFFVCAHLHLSNTLMNQSERKIMHYLFPLIFFPIYNFSKTFTICKSDRFPFYSFYKCETAYELWLRIFSVWEAHF